MGISETQKKILEVGKREFLKKGFKDASLRKIVTEAGFTKGAFYGYYSDKVRLWGRPEAEKMGSFWPRTIGFRPSIVEMPVWMNSEGKSRE